MKGIKDQIRQKWFLRWLLVFTNWGAQGIINADRTEKAYKILFSLLVTGLCYLVLFRNLFGHWIVELAVSFFIGHTINWLVNGSLSTILVHRLFIGNLTKKKAFDYLDDLKIRLRSESAIHTCLVFGSLSRGQLESSSDIDITFVRGCGFWNAVMAVKFMVTEKFRTNIRLIPIEPFLADSIAYTKQRYSPDEVPVVIKGSSSDLKIHFLAIQMLEEANTRNRQS